ncbi:MAG: MraY family glycosyltransferase [Parcubacteria group bacterium]
MLSWAAALSVMLALTITGTAIVVLDPISRRIGLLDHPRGRKDHGVSVPVTGGIAIALGVLIASLFLFDPRRELIALGIASLIVLGMGAWDDVKDLPWWTRIVAQIGAALVLVYVGHVRVEQLGPVFGFAFGSFSLGAFSVPFTVLATVGLINAMNMADGIDGLAGTLSLCALAMLGAASIYAGNYVLAEFLMIVAGSLAGFLLFNMRLPWQPRGRVFLGDAGSGFLGLVIVWTTFRLTQNVVHPVSPVLAPFLIAPPVIDCLVLITRRLMHGRSPFEADRSHLHHLMLDAGVSVTGVVVSLAAFSLALGLAAALLMRAHFPHLLLLGIYGGLTLGYFALTANRDRAVQAFRSLRPDAQAQAKTVAKSPLEMVD